jgi:hypothetical protein
MERDQNLAMGQSVNLKPRLGGRRGINELTVRVAAEASTAIPLPWAATVVDALLRELLQIQDQQMALLAKVEADVQRLVDGPWRTGHRYLREATHPDRSAQQISEALSRALEYFRQAGHITREGRVGAAAGRGGGQHEASEHGDEQAEQQP